MIYNRSNAHLSLGTNRIGYLASDIFKYVLNIVVTVSRSQLFFALFKRMISIFQYRANGTEFSQLPQPQQDWEITAN